MSGTVELTMIKEELWKIDSFEMPKFEKLTLSAG